MNTQIIYKILIIDDNRKDRSTLRRYLYQDQDYKYKIVETKLIQEAWEICDRDRPDLILLDYFCFDNGLKFLQEWQQRYNTSIIPIIVLTKHSNEQIAVEALKNGVQDYCVKTKLTASQFQQIVHNVLENLQLKQKIYRQQKRNLVNSIAIKIRQSLRVDEVLQRTVEEVRQLLQTDRVIIYQFDPDMSGTIIAESVLPQYVACLNRQIKDHCFSENYLEKYRKGRCFIASDIYTAGLQECHITMLETFQVKANLVIPILLNNHSKPELICTIEKLELDNDLWGLLIAHQCDRPRKWHDDEINLLQQLSVQLAIALQQAEMYEIIQAELYARIQAELQEKQLVAAKFRALVENAPDIIFRIDRDMRYLYYNPAIENLIHKPASSLIGQTPEALGVSPDIIAIWRAMVDRILETRVQETIETPFPDWNSLIWFQIRVVPEFNLNNEIESFLCIARDISIRKQYEETLKLQAEMLDQIHDAVISTDINGIIQTWSQGAEKLYGYQAEEVIGQHIIILGHPENANQIYKYIVENLIAQETFEIETFSRTKSGKEIYINLRLRVIRNEKKQIIRLLGCCNDITERKKYEETLKLQAEMLDQIHDAVISTDINGIIQTWNQGAERLYGYTAAEAMGKNVSFIYQNHQEVTTKILPNLIDKGTYELEIVFIGKSGKKIDISLRLSVIRDATGKIIRLIGCSNDITERKRNEETLKMQFQMLDKIHDGVISTDINGIIQTWNQGAEKLHGYTAAEIIGQPITMLCFPEEADQMLKLVFPPLLKKGNHEVEVRNRTKLGEEIYVSLRLSIIHDETGKIIRLIGCSNDITERKKIEKELQQLNQELENRVQQRTEELRKSQRFIETITDNTPNIIYIFDLQERRNIYCNREIGIVLGYSPEEIQSMADTFILNFTHPNDLDQLFIHFNNLKNLKDGEKKNNEYRLRDINGKWRWFLSIDTPFLRDQDGIVKQIIGTAQDITERKEIEKELRNISDRLSLAIASGGLGIWEWDILQNRIIWDERIYELYGINPADVQQSNYELWFNAIHPEDKPKIQAISQKFLRGEAQYNPEFRVIHPDGSIKYIKSYALLQNNAKGEAVRMVGINFDITNSKQTEKQLRNLSERLSIAIESGGFGIWEWDIPEDRIIWDDRVYEIYGINRAEHPEPKYNNWFIKLLHPEDQELLDNSVTQALKNQRKFNQEFRLINADGSIRYIKAYGLIQRNEQGEAVRMIGLNFDITKTKKTEKELRQFNERLTLTNAELDRATKLKDEFLANMSHELRTPLNAILGMTEGLQDGVFGKLNDKQKTALDSIDRSGNHLLTLINDVLDLAKVESGKLELQLAPTSISYICRNSLTFVRQQAIKKNIQIITEIPGNLSDIVIDELRIRQVLINLLNNAVKFTNEGGTVTLAVQSVQTLNQNWLDLFVIDTGIGMKEEDTARLFQPFIQIDSSLNRKYSGTGLGLALVRRLVNLHNGTVSVTSKLGQGSCFTVRLPYIISENTKNQPFITESNIQENTEEFLASKSTPTAIITPIQPSSVTILLVEDNEFNIATISSYLNNKGYKIILAKDGEEGVRIAKLQEPNLILMDIQLPILDGLAAIQQIRDEEKLALTPIIALTALAMPGDQEKCLLAGANDYMSKPVKLKQLVEKIQSLLQTR